MHRKVAMFESHKILGVGPRCAEWLRRQYPRNRGKLIARDFRVHENTAWRWLKGVAPTTAHLEEMSARWGRPWLEFVFAEAAERSDPRLSELEVVQRAIKDEIQAIEEEMRRLEARRAELVDKQEVGRERRESSMWQRVAVRESADLDPPSPARIRRANLLSELAAQTPAAKSTIWIALTRLLWRRAKS